MDRSALDPAALDRQIQEDRAAGRRPFFVAATVGTTSSHAIDPVAAVAQVARSADAWVHVDGAHAGAAAVCPELRFVNDGLELVDSYAFDPHKWLFTNMECDVMYVADRAPLIAALSVSPEYLRNPASDSGAVIDYRDWHLPLGRRFRSLKLWFVLRSYGAEGLAIAVRSHVAWAQALAARRNQGFFGAVRRTDPLEFQCRPPACRVVFVILPEADAERGPAVDGVRRRDTSGGLLTEKTDKGLLVAENAHGLFLRSRGWRIRTLLSMPVPAGSRFGTGFANRKARPSRSGSGVVKAGRRPTRHHGLEERAHGPPRVVQPRGPWRVALATNGRRGGPPCPGHGQRGSPQRNHQNGGKQGGEGGLGFGHLSNSDMADIDIQ